MTNTFRNSLLAAILLYTSCLPKFSCDEWANDFKDSKQFHLVLAKKENNYSRDAYFYCLDLKHNESTEVYDGSGWISHNFDKFKFGDTLLKEKGKYTIIIKRKGKTILLPFECSGKIYVDKKP